MPKFMKPEDRDSDVRIDFRNYELIKYFDMSDDDFILEVQAVLNQLLKNNYVFINKGQACFYLRHAFFI